LACEQTDSGAGHAEIVNRLVVRRITVPLLRAFVRDVDDEGAQWRRPRGTLE